MIRRGIEADQLDGDSILSSCPYCGATEEPCSCYSDDGDSPSQPIRARNVGIRAHGLLCECSTCAWFRLLDQVTR